MLLEASKDTPIHMQVLFNVLMGLRRQEINGVKYSDVDYINRTLTIERQLGKELDRVPYSKKESMAKRELPLKILSSKRVLPDIHWHGLRSTYCTLLLNMEFNMILEQDGDYKAIGTICSIENGELGEVIDRIPYDICVLANLEGIIYKYDDDFAYDDPCELEEINKRIDFEVQQYLSAIRNTEASFPIHAIGKVGHEIYHRHEDVRFVQVMWKERFCASAFEDRYYF